MRWSLVAALIWVCLPLATTASPPPPRPIAQFARLPFIEDPTLSPSGQLLAAKLAMNGQQYLAVVPLDGSQSRLANAGKVDINWFRWVNDDWLIAGVGDTAPVEDEEWYITRLLRVRADMSALKLVQSREAGQHAGDVIWVAHDGTPRILLARQTSIYTNLPGFYPSVLSVDVSTGRGAEVVRSTPGVFDWDADGEGRVRMGRGSSPDGRRKRLLYRDAGGGEFKIIDRANTRLDERPIAPALFLPDGRTALAYHDDQDGFEGLYQLDLQTLAVGKRIFGLAGYDIDGIMTDSAKSAVLGVTVTDTAPRVAWLDQEMAALQAAMDKAVALPRRARIVSLSKDRQRLLVHVASPSEPGQYYVMDQNEGRMRPFAYVNEEIREALHPVETISYKARDGLDISAVLTLPKGRDAKALPLIVMPHGGPFARDAEVWDWWAQFLADRGYAVVQPNYRGSSGFGTRFARAGYGEWGLKMQDDLNDAVAHLAGRGVVDPKRVCIVGGSYGGYAAMRAAQRDGALYRCAVSYAGISDLVRLRRYDSSFLGGGAVGDWLKQQAPDLSAVSPLNFAAEFSIPILLMHGKDDRRVPVNQSRLMAQRLKAAGKAVTYVEQPQGDHFFSREADRIEFLEQLERFLQAHNPSGAGA